MVDLRDYFYRQSSVTKKYHDEALIQLVKEIGWVKLLLQITKSNPIPEANPNPDINPKP